MFSAPISSCKIQDDITAPGYSRHNAAQGTVIRGVMGRRMGSHQYGCRPSSSGNSQPHLAQCSWPSIQTGQYWGMISGPGVLEAQALWLAP